MSREPREPFGDEEDRTLPLGVPVPLAREDTGRRGGLLRRAGKWVLIILGGYYLLCCLLLIAYRFVPPPITTVQLQRHVESLVSGAEYRTEQDRVSLESLPDHVGGAVVAAEDGRFWNHFGYDWEQMLAAQREATAGIRIRGASTITQQLMKNLFGTTHPNPLRKLYDLALTPVAELVLGKERILELYLNQVEWGEGLWGIEAAAGHHYGVDAADLSRTQAAGLAALLPNPRERTPGNTGGYRREILRRMGQ